MTEAGRRLASGRDGDIYEYGPGLVLRRTRRGAVIEREAHVMQYAANHGYPVPRVHEVRAGGTEIVMERLDGPMLMDLMARRPHTLARNARLLADLHDQLHEISAPEWLPRVDDGDRLVHLDLHPMNVMMTSRGPVVIDWTNAASGQPLTDVGLTYVLLTCPRVPRLPHVARAVLQPFRIAIARAFACRYRGTALDAGIAAAAELKMFDPNMRPDEIEKCRRLAARKRRV